jgi:hypothetical protein
MEPSLRGGITAVAVREGRVEPVAHVSEGCAEGKRLLVNVNGKECCGTSFVEHEG